MRWWILSSSSPHPKTAILARFIRLPIMASFSCPIDWCFFFPSFDWDRSDSGWDGDDAAAAAAFSYPSILALLSPSLPSLLLPLWRLLHNIGSLFGFISTSFSPPGSTVDFTRANQVDARHWEREREVVSKLRRKKGAVCCNRKKKRLGVQSRARRTGAHIRFETRSREESKEYIEREEKAGASHRMRAVAAGWLDRRRLKFFRC